MQTLGAHSVLQNQASLLHTAPGEGRVDARPQGTSTRWKKSQAEGASLPPPPRLLPGVVGAGCPRLGHQHIWDQWETHEPQRPEAPRHWTDDGSAAPRPVPALLDSDSPSQRPPPRTCGDGAGIQHGGLCLAWVPRPAASL